MPVKPFVLAVWSTAKVGPDIHVKVGKALYSVPWRLIGQRLDARGTWTTVQLFHNGQLVATHARASKGKRTDMSHYPPEKIAFAMRTPAWRRRRAGEIGPACVAVIASLLEVGLYRLRSAQGVLGLADKHDPQRLEAACGKAIAAGDPSYRTIKGILVAGVETDPPPPSAGDGGASAHLHGPAALFDNAYPLPSRDSSEPPADTAPAIPPRRAPARRSPATGSSRGHCTNRTDLARLAGTRTDPRRITITGELP